MQNFVFVIVFFQVVVDGCFYVVGIVVVGGLVENDEQGCVLCECSGYEVFFMSWCWDGLVYKGNELIFVVLIVV